MTIIAAVCLSLYRINGTQANLSLFITFAAINAVYCCNSPHTSLPQTIALADKPL